MPLVAIVALTGFVVLASVTVPDVGDQGELPSDLPPLLFPQVPFSMEMPQIIAPYAAAVAVVGW